MSVLEKLAAKKLLVESEYNSKIEAIEANAAQLKGEAELMKASQLGELAELEIQLTIDLKQSEDVGYQKCLDDQGVPASDKIYTEADLQAEKELAVKPFLEQVASLEAKVVELANKVLEVEASVQPKIDQAVAAKQAEMVADFEAAQVDDQAFLGKYKV